MTTMRSDSLQRLADRYGQAWNTQSLDEIMSMHTEDTVFRLHLLGAPAVAGHAAVRDAFAGLFTAWPDIHFGTERLGFGNDFFVHQFVITATLAVPFPIGDLVAQPTGEPVRFAGTDVITTVDDLVHCKETYLDIAAAQRQLGGLS